MLMWQEGKVAFSSQEEAYGDSCLNPDFDEDGWQSRSLLSTGTDWATDPPPALKFLSVADCHPLSLLFIYFFVVSKSSKYNAILGSQNVVFFHQLHSSAAFSEQLWTAARCQHGCGRAFLQGQGDMHSPAGMGNFI